ncbi:MAG TPA: lipopolysaccharide heptosyltransferase II [Candidatus Acidoferrales bacterium]|nr:lipopolysaccharide heptosyltransferase II [Candidatus Acidoferrales bacterium]
MKLLVRATNWVGDAILCIPALAALRARWPDAEIAVLARPWVADLYRDQALVDRLIPYDHRGRHRGIAGIERLAGELRALRFDSAVLFQNAFEAAWIAWRAGIPERIGYARDARGPLLTRSVPVPLPGEIPPHEANYYLELLRRAGWIAALPEIPPVRLRVAPDALDRAEKFLRDAGCPPDLPRVAFGPGAAYGTAKCWPANRYADLARRLAEAHGVRVLLFGAASEAAVAAEVELGAGPAVINLIGRSAIGDLPALLARCHLFVGNDSGAMHVAAAVGLPVVAVFGPTDPEGTRPLASQLSIVQRRVACSPCFLRHCPIDHRCMKLVDLQLVLDAARGWLASLPARKGQDIRG